MNKLILATILTVSSSIALADSVIITQTKTWKSVPITIDAKHYTYTTVEGTLVPDGEYYYTYSGYRCLTKKIEVNGSNVIVYKSSAGGNEIYCYADE